MFVDFHCDTLYRLVDKGTDFFERTEERHVDFPRMKEGKVHLQVFAVFVDPKFMRKNAATMALKLIDKMHEIIDKSSEIELVLRGEDIDRIKSEGKIGALLSIEGGEALEGEIALLRIFYKLGVRAITLTWSLRNDLGDGVEGVPDAGLTSFGKQVVKEMNRLGMIVDVSHLNEKGFWDVIEISEKPVIASHSNAKALCSHRRNLTDEQIKAIAQKGGVIGINFAPQFLRDDKRATIEDVLNHIDYMVDLVGEDYVGFGSDFDGISSTPEGLEDISKFPKIVEGLIKRGYTQEQIDKITHKNFENLIKKIL
ncbi:MAG: Zn-dependent dipeptidase, microsomal dipeptidase-like protein [Caldanaerobacter subterraneus]|uniref:Dipeptidase n=1 Tax=Caldanaerobacter subterraneus TaxID=911092 RepID=A0A101E6B3_9THEO|nr:dipeptidase [Caldanaerobacter subterraneus]KUK09614.1 MAG: Zn-dependent dipeptidase, microsomal dipeptidase-like protein [Caldanaerobacter subterraneus]HBT48808.1 dipeptidase [Caldanaerobacter subterraneus]